MPKQKTDYTITGPNFTEIITVVDGGVDFAPPRLLFMSGWEMNTVVKRCRANGWTITPEPPLFPPRKDNTAGFF